jgi:hypothetical protein
MEEPKKGAGRPVHIPSPWGELAKAMGGTNKLAEKLCVSGATVNRWANSVHRVPEMAKKEIRRLCKYYSIETDY